MSLSNSEIGLSSTSGDGMLFSGCGFPQVCRALSACIVSSDRIPAESRSSDFRQIPSSPEDQKRLRVDPFKCDRTAVHGKKSILRMKTAFIDCAEAKFHFVVAICIVLS